jgi:hypothetical protein
VGCRSFRESPIVLGSEGEWERDLEDGEGDEMRVVRLILEVVVILIDVVPAAVMVRVTVMYLEASCAVFYAY